MFILKLSIPWLVFIVAIAQIGLEYCWHDKRTKLHKRIRGVLLCSLLVLTVGNTFMVVHDEKSLRPRVLSETDIRDLTVELKKYSGMKVRLRRSIGDLEIADVLDQVENVFRNGGWKIDELSTDKTIKKGIVFYAKGDEVAPSTSVVKELASICKKNGFSYDLIRDQSFPTDTIGIDVGAK